MKPLTPNQRAAKALTAMRDAMAKGAPEAQIIAAGEKAAGGDDAAKMVGILWRNQFLITRAN